MASDKYTANYRVQVTGTALKQGQKLPVTDKVRAWIIQEMLLLKYWPQIADRFDHEPAFGAIEFKFGSRDHWIRVFAYQDDERKTMWIIKVMVKKSNELRVADKVSITTAISRIKQDIEHFKKQQEEQKKNLKFLKGGQQDESR